MGFSDHLKKAAQPIWDAQLLHPFVLGLGDGSLPEAKFKFYILQDALFLFDLAKLFALAATRAPDLETMAYLSKLQVDTLQVERALHQEYAKRWQMSEAEMASVPMAPTNYAYTRHLLSIAQTGSLAEILVAGLPCAWIYCEVGSHFCRQGPPPAAIPTRTGWLSMPPRSLPRLPAGCEIRSTKGPLRQGRANVPGWNRPLSSPPGTSGRSGKWLGVRSGGPFKAGPDDRRLGLRWGGGDPG